MLWNRTLLILLVVFAFRVDSKYLGLPDPVKYISVSSEWQRMDNGSEEPVAIVKWEAYETDTTHYEIEFVGVNNGKSIIETVKPLPKSKFELLFLSDHKFSGNVHGLKINKTYIVRVFAVNAQGKSPPSPDIIFCMDESQTKSYWNWGPEPSAPSDLEQSRSGNRVNVTWSRVYRRENIRLMRGPIEYTFRYGNNKNTSLWESWSTFNDWVILDDLENGKQYSGYVFVSNGNLTSVNSGVIPISLDEDMSGLPEPVITIEPKKKVYRPGDPMTIKCTLPPNIRVTAWMSVDDLIVARQSSQGYETVLTYHTKADKEVNSIECYIFDGKSRSSYLSWKVKKPSNDKHLQRRRKKLKLIKNS